VAEVAVCAKSARACGRRYRMKPARRRWQRLLL
jgi:hypothetical protein